MYTTLFTFKYGDGAAGVASSETIYDHSGAPTTQFAYRKGVGT